MVIETAIKTGTPKLSKEALALLHGPTPMWPQTKADLDYALLPNGELIRLRSEDYKEPDHKTYPDAIPLVWPDWLKGPAGDGYSTLSIGDAIVIVATGLKGSGKSETLAYLTAKALVLDMPVWSNMGVKFWFVKPDGGLKLCQTEDLDWNAVLLLSKELEHGALVIDELSYYASSRQSSSVRNRILNAAVNQVRKRTLDFYTSVKFLRQIDINIREELDCEIACEDASRNMEGQRKGLDKGCFVRWRARDISGWSGHAPRTIKAKTVKTDPFDPLGEPIYRNEGARRIVYLRFTWPIYNSYDVVEMADAFRKVKLDLEETVITDKQTRNETQCLLEAVVDTFTEQGEYEPDTGSFRDAAAKIGVKLGDKALGKALKDMFGVTRKRTNKRNYYILPEE